MESPFEHRRFPFLSFPISVGVASGITLIVIARWVDAGAPSLRGLAGGTLAVVLPAFVVATFQRRGRPVAAAAVLLACTPTVVVATADGRWQGGVALLMVGLIAWAHRPAVAALLAAVAVAACAAWWRAGFDRGNAPGPSWRDVVGETGETVRRSLTSVGLDETLIPLTAALLLAVGIGVLSGAAVVAGRPARATIVLLGVALLVGGIWAIRLWRGSVDPLGGAWLLSAAVALVAVAAEPPTEARRRIATGIALLGSLVWLLALWADVGRDHPLPAVLVAAGVVLVGVTLTTRPVGRPVPAPPAR